MDDNTEDKWFFLLENYYKSSGFKGFCQNYDNSPKTASFYSPGKYAQPCIQCLSKKLGFLAIYEAKTGLFTVEYSTLKVLPWSWAAASKKL